jgi:Ni,Fe-hydrogenase I small subunit
MSADTLTVSSRNFFERTKSKVAISIIVSAAGLFALGFCSAAGGISAAYGEFADNAPTNDQKDGDKSIQGGFGKLFFIVDLSSSL